MILGPEGYPVPSHHFGRLLPGRLILVKSSKNFNSEYEIMNFGKGIPLTHEGMNALIELTNQQFDFWHKSLCAETDEAIPSGSLMHYWFILSRLALSSAYEFRVRKKDMFYAVPNLSPEAVRKHVAAIEKLGFVETVKSKGQIYLQLAPSGQRVVSMTLSRWVNEFSYIHRKFFS